MLDADSAPAASAPERFTWVPIYREVAAKVLEYRDRPGELIDLLTDMVDLKVVSTRDQNPEGNWIPLGDIDPFTFFSSFNRKITLANRRAILERLKRTWNLSADVPTDFEGVPLVNNQSAWFFSYRFRRRDEDIPLLWEVAQAGYSGGPDSLSESLWNRCHRIRQIATPKLTMGLFWLNPTQYLPLDRGTRKYAAARGISVPPFPTLEQYRAFLGEVRTKIDNDLVSVSAATYAGLPDEAGLEPRYWVGGHHWSDGSKLDAFREKEAWWHGWSRDGDADAAKVWKVFDQIAVGDYFAIKGYGGTNDLRVHFVGTVSEKDDSGRVELAPLPLPDPPNIKPARGTGSWFGTLREVTDPAIIAWMFHGEPYAPTETKEEENGATVSAGPLNTILYGPPGTGKTFATIRRAVEIADPDFRATSDEAREAHRERKARFDELRAEGRIEFVTFHQSFGYEEFVEGIRPVMDGGPGDGMPRYAVQDGVLKQIALRALAELLEPVTQSATRGRVASGSFAAYWEAFLEEVQQNPDRLYPGLSKATDFRLYVSEHDNIRARNTKAKDISEREWPFNVGRDRMAKVWATYPGRTKVNTTDVKTALGKGAHDHVFAAVFRELKRIEDGWPKYRDSAPAPNSEDIARDYLRSGEASGYRLKHSAEWPRFVLVVDEINRGNVSRILGELITLVEDDKRVGSGENDLTVTLPHSRETFGLPANLYLLGTMNTADKSIALVDVALRRRFAFEELTPDFGPDVCPGLTDAMRVALTTLNRRIALRLDRDHRIGHAYFVRVSDEAGFDEVFARRIVPLLQEYFYNDWDGLRYVLGENGRSGPGRFIVPQGGDDREVRTRWRWRTDDGEASDPADAAISPLAALLANYG